MPWFDGRLFSASLGEYGLRQHGRPGAIGGELQCDVSAILTNGAFHGISTSRKHPHLSLFAHLSFIGLSWVLISTVIKLARSDRRFLSYSLRYLGEVGLQRYF